MKNAVSRRKLFKQGGIIGAGVILSQAGIAAGVVTPEQTEGPFYPVLDQIDKDADLTQIAGRSRAALGEAVIVKGRVRSTIGDPISGAFIDVWQACDSGKYNHEQDPNDAPLDPNFQYWARLKTNNAGEFSFKTIIPGAYPATSSWLRPPHIHFRVDAFKHGRLTTQMYFKGSRHNAADQILIDTERRFGRDAKNSLIVDFGSDADSDGTPVGLFEITLGSTPGTEV